MDDLKPISDITRGLLMAACLVSLAACDSEEAPLVGTNAERPTCSVAIENFVDGGVGKDVIPALTDPPLVGPDEAAYLADADRIIGLLVAGQPVAVPHNILWFHEIINFNFATEQLAVTYCPLTGSSLAFDRVAVGGGEFGVSGLLWQNNLTMFDRTTSESLWPQMSRNAVCGPRLGASLEMYPVVEMTWGAWRALYPGTQVVSNNTGTGWGYTAANYPYGNYEVPENDGLLFDMPIDTQRPPKERVLALPDGRLGGIAYPFLALDEGTPLRVLNETTDAGRVVVFWSRAAQAATMYRPTVDRQTLRFTVREGRIFDDATQSEWQINGVAVAGPLAGTRLEPMAEAYVAFWFAWAAFHPETRIWGDG